MFFINVGEVLNLFFTNVGEVLNLTDVIYPDVIQVSRNAIILMHRHFCFFRCFFGFDGFVLPRNIRVHGRYHKQGKYQRK